MTPPSTCSRAPMRDRQGSTLLGPAALGSSPVSGTLTTPPKSRKCVSCNPTVSENISPHDVGFTLPTSVIFCDYAAHFMLSTISPQHSGSISHHDRKSGCGYRMASGGFCGGSPDCPVRCAGPGKREEEKEEKEGGQFINSLLHYHIYSDWNERSSN